MNVKLRCFQSTRKLQSWFSVKDRQALLNRFNIVYKLTCSCGASYIGQTQRNLENRIEEHRTSLSSAVCRHLQANPDHQTFTTLRSLAVTTIGLTFTTLRSLAVTTIGDGCRFLNLYWSKNTNHSWMQTSRRCLYAFLTCKRASCLTHDVTCNHHWRVSSWVMWLRMLRATTSLLKQPFVFFIFHSAFLLSDQ